MRDIRVDYYGNHERKVSIYNRMGGGNISLTEEEAEYVKERLDEVVD